MSADTFALTATANDEALAWCEAPFEAVYATFSDGVTSFPQRGTPGVVNEFCGFGF
jgi:hypothetical protein